MRATDSTRIGIHPTTTAGAPHNTRTQLPISAWAYDPRTRTCRRVRWSDPREPRQVRLTALAVAQLEIEVQGCDAGAGKPAPAEPAHDALETNEGILPAQAWRGRINSRATVESRRACSTHP